MHHPLARCCLLAGLLACAPGLLPAAGEEAAPPDPLPLRRVQLPPDRVAAELERVRQGLLLQWPRDEFEAKLRRARQAADALKKPPRLALARYRARLTGNALVGRGDWTVVNPAPRPAVWAIPDLNLALSEVRLQAGDAVLGELDGKTLGLLVAKEGKQEVFFDWSLRGLAGARGLLFDLRVPACGLASLELTLPADHTVSVPRAAGLLLGPFPAEEKDFRVWRLHFAGRSQVDLTVRKDDRGGGAEARLVLWQADGKQTLAPDRLRADFDFQIEALHRGVRELVFAYDPRLQPYAVEGRGLEVERWGFRDAKNARPDQPRLLVVTLHEAVLGPLPPLRVRCLAPLAEGQFWKSPGVALRGAVPRGETLTVIVPPTVQTENWQAGRYRLVKSTAQADGTQEIVWQGPGGADAAGRPGARVLTEGAALRSRQRLWWQLGPHASQATAVIDYEVTRGRVFHLPVRLPPGWQVEGVALSPEQVPIQWYPAEERGETVLRVDLQQALTPSLPARLTVRLRGAAGPGARRPGRVVLDFPRVRPLHTGPHEGALAVGVDPYYEAQGPPGGAAPERDGPWGTQVPAFYYPYRGEPPAGRIVLRTHAPHLRARCISDVVLSSGRAAQAVRLRVEASSGDPDTLDLHLSAPVGAFAGWKTDHPFNAVRRAERLHALEIAPGLLTGLTPPAAHLPFGAVATAAAAARPPAGQRWRLTLAQPLREHEPITLETTLEQDLRTAPWEWAAPVAALAGAAPLDALPLLAGILHRPPEGRAWDVPLISLPGAAQLDGEVTLYLAGAEALRVETRGLQEDAAAGASPAAAPPGPRPWRTFRYGRGGPGEPPPRLRVSGEASPVGSLAEEACDFVRFITEVEPQGRLVHRLEFRVSRWGKRVFQVRLPPGSRLLTLRTEGRWVEQVPRRDTPQGLELDLPVAAAADQQQFEIAYTRPRSPGFFGDVLEAPLPQLPLPPAALRRVWRLPPDLVPLYPEQFRRLPGGAPAKGDGVPWTEWAPVAGPGPHDRLEAVWRPAVPALGMLLAAALLLLAVALRGVPASWRVCLLLAWVGAAGLVYLWLPAPLCDVAAWPALAGLGVALWSFAGPRARPTFARASTRTPIRAVPAAVVLFLAGAWLLRAGPGDPPYPVLILPDVPAKGKQSVLIPADLAKKLDELAARDAAGPGGAVLVAARYEGTVNGANVDFAAQFQVYSFADRATLTLPLAGVELNEGALLQGADVFPVPLPAPRAGYSLPVTGKGFQKLELRFRARAAATADGRELRLAIPRLAQSRLLLTLPAAAQAPQAVSALGAQKLTALPGGQRQLQADLGRDATLQVRWRLPGGAARKPVVKVQEAYLWQVRPGGDALTGVLGYAISGGEVARVALAVPVGLAVGSVEVGPARGQPGADEAPRLKSWRLLPPAAGQKTRRLEVDLQAPATAGFLLTLGLLPRAPLTGGAVLLPLPAPLGAEPTRGLLAYRVRGAEAGQKQQQLGVTSVTEESFADAWRKDGMGDPGPLTRAFSFRRAPGGDGVAGLWLTLRPPPYQAAVETTWRVRHRQADFKATVPIKAPAGAVSLLEMDVPAAVRLTRVIGAQVHGWSRTGPRVQIWLKESAKQTTLDLEGWVPLAEPAADVREGRFDLPAFRFPHAEAAAALVQVTADPDLTLELTHARNLAPAPMALPVLEHLPAKILTYVTEPGPYEGQFRVRVNPVIVLARSFTQVERRADRLEFTALVRCEIPYGEVRHLVVEASGGPAEGVRVEAPRALVVPVKDPKRRAWTLTLLPGAARHYEFQVRGRLPAGEAASVPDVRVVGAVPKERWLAVLGNEVRPLEARGLQAVTDPAAVLHDWPMDAVKVGRLGAVWQVTATDWRLRLRQAAAADVPPVRILLEERAAAVADGRSWLHEASYLLYARRGAGLRFALPAGAVLVGADVAGRPVAPGRPAAGHIWLPLAEGAGPYRVRLRWRYEAGAEDFARPRGDGPLPEEGAKGDAPARLWTVEVPDGYRLRLAPVPAPAALLELYRADALLRLSKLLVESSLVAEGAPEGPLFRAQREFYACCLRAETALKRHGGAAPGKGPAGQGAGEWLKQLRQQDRQLAKAQGFERLRGRAERAGAESEDPPSLLPAFEPRGHAVSWAAGEAPQIALEPRSEEERRETWAATAMLIAALLAVWLLVRYPVVCAVGRALWPEWMILLGAAGWWLLGLPVLALPVLAMPGVLARLWVAARWLGGLRPRPRPAGSSGS
jgi:hypothetical protein